MTRLEKVGKVAWVIYFFAAFPLALFLVAMWIVLVPLWFRESIGPVENAPAPALDQLAVWGGLVLFPVVVMVSAVMAPRFEKRKTRFIPFLANLIPVTALLRLSYVLMRDEGDDFLWVLFYPAALIVLLLAGLVSVTMTACPGGEGD